MKRSVCLAALVLGLLVMPAVLLWAQKGATLTEEEENKLREAQDPAERIEVYLGFSQARLDRFDDFRRKPADPQYDNGAYLDQLLDQYIAVNDELKNWIEFQYQRHGDMRRGLRALLKTGPKQLEEFRRIQQSPDTFAAAYGNALRDAIDQLTDLIDGGTKAFGDQGKQLGELQRKEKAAVRLSKERRKEEGKRNKEEKKLRKRQHKGGVPGDAEVD